MEYSHLSNIVHEKAKLYGEEEAIKVRNESTKQWSSISWNEFSRQTMIVAESLCNYGIQPQDNIGIYSQNLAECLYIDFGAFANRAVMVPMYATSSIPQITYIINEAEIEVLFVGEQWQYDNAFEVAKTNRFLKLIVILDKTVKKDTNDNLSVYFDEFCKRSGDSEDKKKIVSRTNDAIPEDLAHIIYTSGTTGEPKGVMITHSNYIEVCKTHDIRLNYLPPRFLSVCFLPMTHIFEKAWSIYCVHKACTLAISYDPREIQTYIKEIRPEALCSVPRFWEKVYAGIQEKIEAYPSIVKKLFAHAVKIGHRHNLEYINKQKKPPFGLKLMYTFYDKTIFNTIKKVVGLERGLIFPAAGAALSEKIIVFLRSINIPLVYGYGLTETTATVSCFPLVNYELGTVGKIMPEAEVRIGENNEIQVRAKSVMKGYYKKAKATQEAFTEDGFFRTGDAGRLTENNGIIMTERIKDLYKTSNGKYIAPQQLEARLMDDLYIDSAIIIADQRKFVSALIIPAVEELKAFAVKNNITFSNIKDLIDKQQIKELFNKRINAMQDEFASYEQIKRFTLLPEPFTIQTGELTNTLKMKRAFIAEKFKDLIDKMYE